MLLHYNNIMCHLRICTGAERSRSIGSVFCLLCSALACPRMALLNCSHCPDSKHMATVQQRLKTDRTKGSKRYQETLRSNCSFHNALAYAEALRQELSASTKPPLTVWSEPVRSRALHADVGRGHARARVSLLTPRALLRICPLQSSRRPRIGRRGARTPTLFALRFGGRAVCGS